MHRIYEWLRIALNEKVNLFIRGLIGGCCISGIFLFRSPIHDATVIIFFLVYCLKLLAVGLSGIISGCASVLGNDLAKWIKSKWRRATVKRVQNRKKKAA